MSALLAHVPKMGPGRLLGSNNWIPDQRNGRLRELAQGAPWLPEERLTKAGANYVPGLKHKDVVVVDGNLITGQNEHIQNELLRLL